jgi:tryptophan 2,3-dioxygenase
MGADTSRKILEKIDEILAAIGQPDREAFRETMRRSAALFTNLNACCTVIAKMTDDDFQRLVNRLQDNEQEQALKMLVALQSSFLPMAARAIIDYAQTWPQSPGGRPPSFKDRESKQAACSLVLEFIGKGYSEAIAIRSAARKLHVSIQTMRRTWKRRAELTTEEDIGEFIGGLLSGFATPQPSEAAQSGDVKGNLPAPSDAVLQAARTVEQHVMSNRTLGQKKQE